MDSNYQSVEFLGSNINKNPIAFNIRALSVMKYGYIAIV